jgi:cytochrome c553
MAGLMEQMYVQNLSVKEKIAKGEAIGEFPEYYLKINTAKFTDEADNDFFFKADSKNLKENYNAGVDACITCHQKKCGGPIPKIKKLYIK